MDKGDRQAVDKNRSERETSEKDKLKEAQERIRETQDVDGHASALDRIDRDLDAKLMDRIEAKYSQWIPAERLTAARGSQPEIRRDQEFEEGLKKISPGMDEEDAERVVGYKTDQGVFVRRNQDVPTTLAHERFHQVAHPEAEAAMGKHLYEGMTEDLANQEFPSLKLYEYERRPDGRLTVNSPQEVYPKKTETFTLLQSQVPQSCCMEAYFKGDTQRLEAFVDAEHGQGSWREIRSLLDRAEQEGDTQALNRAREILKSR